MKFNGKELIEMVPGNWDDKARQMLVWNDNDASCHLAYVLGFSHIQSTINGFDYYDRVWYGEGGKYWNHCAEIPVETYISNNLTEEEIIEKFKTLRTELKRWLKNNDSRNLLVNNLQYSIKTALNLTDVNKHLSEVVDFSKIDTITNMKKTRRMTYRELAKWISNGNGEWAFSEKCDNNVSIHSLDFVYYACDENKPVSGKYKIRGWDDTEWHEPLIEEE